MTNPKHYPILIEAILKNDREGIIRIIEDNPSTINLSSNDKLTPLMFAIRKRNQEIIKLLVEKGADLESQDSEGMSILQWAIYYNDNFIFDKIINQDINLDTIDHIGRTALNYAIELRKVNYAMVLIRNGADVNIVDNEGLDALCLAQMSMPTNCEIRKELIKHGAFFENPAQFDAFITCLALSIAAGLMLATIPAWIHLKVIFTIFLPFFTVLALGAIASGIWYGSEPLYKQIKNPVKAVRSSQNYKSNNNNAEIRNQNNQEMTQIGNGNCDERLLITNRNLQHN